jgi:hypothetical protein
MRVERPKGSGVFQLDMERSGLRVRTYVPGTHVTDPSGPPRPPAYTLIWMVVVGLALMLVIAVLRGWA